MKIPEPIIEPIDDHRGVERAQLAHQDASLESSASVVSVVTGCVIGLDRQSGGRRLGLSDSRSFMPCSTNALTSAIACSIVSRRQSVSAESRAQASLLTRWAAASLGDAAFRADLGKIAVMDDRGR